MATKTCSIPVLKLTKASKAASVSADPAIFSQTIKPATLSQVLRAYIHNSHQQTTISKTRGDVDLTKAKVYRQKGTGRARHGAKSAPIFVGGGVTHGPKGHITRLKVPQKLKIQATKALLTNLLNKDKIYLYKPEKFTKPQTKKAFELLSLNKLADQKLNLVLGQTDHKENANLPLSFNNIPKLKILSSRLNPHQLANSNVLILSESALEELNNRLNKTK